MKKLALTFAFVLGISLCSLAQGGFFKYGEVYDNEEESYGTAWYIMDQPQDLTDNSLFSRLKSSLIPDLPDHGQDGNQDAPLGSGALLLIGFGAAYALKKKSKE